jgi:hypothetical protein
MTEPKRSNTSESIIYEVRRMIYRHLVEWGKDPRFLIVGGEPYAALKLEAENSFMMAKFKVSDPKEITECFGLTVVKVRRDALEVGE